MMEHGYGDVEEEQASSTLLYFTLREKCMNRGETHAQRNCKGPLARTSFSTGLESRARELLERETDGPVKALGKEIALLLDHLERLRALEERLNRSLLRVECYVDTELMQMEQRTPRYSPYRFPEREKLQRRLGEIEKERRQLVHGHERERRELHDRLSDAVRKHELLDGDKV